MKKTLTILSSVIITLITFSANAQTDTNVQSFLSFSGERASNPLPGFTSTAYDHYNAGFPKANVYFNNVAEDTTVHSYLTLLGGVGIPVGNFASSNYSNNKAGFAKKGMNFGLDGAFVIHKSLSFGLSFIYHDQGELNANDVQNLANGYNASFVKDVTTATSVNRLDNITLMGGPQYSFLYKKFQLDLRVDAGALKSLSTPSLTVAFNYSTAVPNTFEQLSSSALGFAYGGSVGLRWSFADNWDIGIKANYIDCPLIKIENNNNTGTVGRFVTNQPVSIIETTAGITLRF